MELHLQEVEVLPVVTVLPSTFHSAPMESYNFSTQCPLSEEDMELYHQEVEVLPVVGPSKKVKVAANLFPLVVASPSEPDYCMLIVFHV